MSRFTNEVHRFRAELEMIQNKKEMLLGGHKSIWKGMPSCGNSRWEQVADEQI